MYCLLCSTITDNNITTFWCLLSRAAPLKTTTSPPSGVYVLSVVQHHYNNITFWFLLSLLQQHYRQQHHHLQVSIVSIAATLQTTTSLPSGVYVLSVVQQHYRQQHHHILVFIVSCTVPLKTTTSPPPGVYCLLCSTIKDNNITTFWSGTFDHTPRLRALRISGNQLICDCQLGWLSRWLSSAPHLAPYIRCSSPNRLKDRIITDVPQNEFKCAGE